jgi:hypothetical protein
MGQRLANVPVALLLLAQTVPFWRKLDETDCDNLAGGCIRIRQELAMALVMLVCVTTAALCLWNAASPVGKSQHPRWRHGVLLGSATLLLVIWIVNPMGNLDNRFSGWLSGATVLPVRWRLPAAAARPARVVFLPASLSPTSERQGVHE